MCVDIYIYTHTTLMGLFLSERLKMQRLTIFSSPVGSAGKDLRDGGK